MDLRPFFESGYAGIRGYGLNSIFEKMDLKMTTTCSFNKRKKKSPTKRNGGRAIVPKVNISSYLAQLEKVKAKTVCLKKEVEALASNDVTTKHLNCCDKIVRRFVEGLRVIGEFFCVILLKVLFIIISINKFGIFSGS